MYVFKVLVQITGINLFGNTYNTKMLFSQEHMLVSFQGSSFIFHFIAAIEFKRL